MAYDFGAIENKWQLKWEKERTFYVETRIGKPKFYCLEMFPYPSGALHMGHVRNYSMGDMLARFMRKKGFNVLYPMGFDAFGLPAENAAIKSNTHPNKWTLNNIEHMTLQLKRMGYSYDWNRRVATCQPDYYKWNQWIFLQMYKKGLAYRKMAPVNWCEKCSTVLANEQVQDGRCWRCDNQATKKKLEQWFLRITDYAPELYSDIDDKLNGWPDRVRTMQRNWIGRSTGARLSFNVPELDAKIETYTTRFDTIFGVTYIALAPEHDLVQEIMKKTSPEKCCELTQFVEKCSAQSSIERSAAGGEKLGFDTGISGVNPVTGELIPIWLANYILMDYGTGAIMGVPAHDQRDFEFCRKFNIPVVPVINPEGEVLDGETMKESFVDDGIVCNSGKFNGMRTGDAIPAMIKWGEETGVCAAEVNFRLRDWLVSRQRYWGTPIPIVYCDKCGIVPIPEDMLPVELPLDIQLLAGGGTPLPSASDWVNTACPVCGAHARRETDTLDTFFCSSWYFLRYCSPGRRDVVFDALDTDYWMAVDQYIGGIEHACMHLIYARYFTKFLRNIGMLRVDEPFENLLTQGMVIKDGAKMSKSLGNVVDPTEIVNRYGADTVRLFILFAAPPQNDLDWSEQGVEGAHRFLNRVWRAVEENLDGLTGYSDTVPVSSLASSAQKDFKRKIHTTILDVTRDIVEEKQFNTAVARMMELVNAIYAFKPSDSNDWKLMREAVCVLLNCLFPFCPHITSELWQMLGNASQLDSELIPECDGAALVVDEVTIVVQINGKVREKLTLPAGLEKRELEKRVTEHPDVASRIEGKEIAKIISVPNKLVNIVISDE
ncbi:MAG: leucine--tRNA ligase [Synergistaceae bacterium]|nr:leucine--tRNA ligase [Synergistaceae bacterium]